MPSPVIFILRKERETRRKKDRNRDSSRRGAQLKGSENARVPGRGAASWGMTQAHATHAPSIHTLHQHVQNVCYLPQEAGRKQPEMTETALQCDFHCGSKMWETMRKPQKELPGAYFKATLVVSTEGTEHGIRRHSFEFRLCLQWLVTLGKVREILRASVYLCVQRGTSWGWL